MARITPIKLVTGIHGKLSSDSEYSIVTNSYNGNLSTRKIGNRDKEAHPVTEREVDTHTKLQEATAAYHKLKQAPEQYQQFLQQYEAAKAKGLKKDAYRYFLHLYLDEGKNSVSIRIAKTKSNEASYARGMTKCQTVEEADKLLVKFVEKLGYKELAEAYKQVVQKSKKEIQ